MLLEVEEVAARYGKALALTGVTLHVDEGELVGVLGPNGAGKTTLLKVITQSMRASAGRITFRGHRLDGLAVDRVVALGICHCPEGRRLFPELSVRQNLLLGAYLRRNRTEIADDLRRVEALFPVLRQRARQPAGTLSGGEQQMLAIGRALMGRPALLLLDEPSTGIAHGLKLEIAAAIHEVRRAGTAILLVEQDAEWAGRLADRLYILEQGRVAFEGNAAALADHDPIRRAYFGV